MNTTNQKGRAPQAFFYALLTATLIFLPFILYDGGYFIYYGDFNVQQIPFYKLAHQAVRSGDIFWSWNTDLGANFIGSYSFYLLFSPFFWLTLPFPNAWVPFLMAPLLIVKTACAALTAYFYLRRMVRDQRYAVVASLLYAFSGWMAFNIFFNHFHEVAVFFPLLLIGVEQLVTEDKHGPLAFAVLVNAVVNYWFFVGEAVFVVLYVILRATDRSWGLTVRRFLAVALEALLGFACAAAAVLPSVMALLGNPRTGAEELLNGWNLWLYWHEQRQPAIIQSLFFPPELPARPNFLPGHGAKWASLSGWLPLVTMTGVLAYFFRRKNDWLKKLLALCLVFALVPGLNSLFILLNDSYYARWFYMPVLLMALATARALEDAGEGVADYRRAVKWTAIVLLLFALMCGLTPVTEDGQWTVGLADDPQMLWIYVAVAMACVALTGFLVLRLRGHRRFPLLLLCGVMAVSVGFTVFYIANGKYNRTRADWLIDHAIEAEGKISLPDGGEFSRIDVYDSLDNLGMFWGLPTIQAFHSIVPPSLMEFYPEIGVTRDVASRPETDFYALRPLLSVRWLFIEDDVEEQAPMPGYHFYDNQNGFNIYENDLFLPMGFTYDHYVTPWQMEDVAREFRSNLMLRAVVLDEQAAARNADILAPLPDEGYQDFTPEDMEDDVAQRRLFPADGISIDRRGFTVATSFGQPRLLFLSVPYEAGWSAHAPGYGKLRIEKANIGFMAVRVPEGASEIRFDYQTPGLAQGLAASAAALLLLAGYLLITWRRGEPSQQPRDVGAALRSGQTVTLSWQEYEALMGDREKRAADLQQTLNEASARHIAEELPDAERTLRFASGEQPGPPAETPAAKEPPLRFSSAKHHETPAETITPGKAPLLEDDPAGQEPPAHNSGGLGETTAESPDGTGENPPPGP